MLRINLGQPPTAGANTLTYDGLDRMVEKQNGSAFTQFVYNPAGGLLALMSGQAAVSVRVPLPNAWAVYGTNGVFDHYEHLDWLGSSRISSSQSRTLISDVAYAPFGEPYASSSSTGISFTGMRSDVVPLSGSTTNGLYDFPAREYPPTQGRWISPDPLGSRASDPTNPQSWNLYAYVLNNPLVAIDPDGLDCIYLNDVGNGVESIDQDSSPSECSGVNAEGKENGGYWIPGSVSKPSWVTIDQSTNEIGAFSVLSNGTIGFTASTADFGGAWQTVALNVSSSPVGGVVDIQTSPSSQQAMVAIANVFNNDFPTVCHWSTSARLSVAGFGVGVNDTDKGTSFSYGPTATLSNKLRVTVGLNSRGLGAPDPGSSIRVGSPTIGVAFNPSNGQVGGYVGRGFKVFGRETGATLTATIGNIGTNNTCGK